jgi:hypothetical protein
MTMSLLHKMLQFAIASTLVVCWTADANPEESEFIERVSTLTRSSEYSLVDSIPLSFDTHHPQGMTIIDDKVYLTSVHATDRANGKGVGYLYEVSMKGELLRSIELGEGANYHPGGIDFDGEYIWVSVAEYRPDSKSIVYRVDPKTMKSEEIFRFDDHLGAIVSLKDSGLLFGASWGSRTFYRWDLDDDNLPIDVQNPIQMDNGSHFVDYQDGQWVKGTDTVLFGGVAGYRGGGRRETSLSIGGLALMEANGLTARFEVPVLLYSKRGRVMNQNPFYVQLAEKGRLKLYFIPDDNRSVLYIYSVETGR